jgi:hypothetical protein
MSRTPDRQPHAGLPTELPPALAEYAEQLLLGTGLDAREALRVACGEVDAAPGLSGLAEALRAGWSAGEADSR